MILTSAAEPPSLRALGPYSPLCEQNGMDFLIPDAKGEFHGAQRKECRDLVASLRGKDARLSRELGMSEHLASATLIIEGDWRWDAQGRSRRARGWDQPQLEGLIMSIMHEHGWFVREVKNMAGTAELLRRMESWHAKTSHGSLLRRPKPEKMWGEDGHRATGIHILQSIDGNGPGVGGAIFDHFGRVPLAWTCTREEMKAVPGVGPNKVEKMFSALP